jgi:hypothetical protein
VCPNYLIYTSIDFCKRAKHLHKNFSAKAGQNPIKYGNKEGCQIIRQGTPISIISTCFIGNGKDGSSSEALLQSSKSGEDLIYTQNCPLLSKYLNSNS